MATEKQVDLILSLCGKVEGDYPRDGGKPVAIANELSDHPYILRGSNTRDVRRAIASISVPHASALIDTLKSVLGLAPIPAAAKTTGPFVSESAEINGYQYDRGEDN